MKGEPMALNQLIESVADGHPIEWETITANPGSSEERLIRHLRILVGVAEGHRTAAQDEAASTHGAMHELDAEHPGAHWGHLLLKEKIGEGAFGEVYRACDPWLDRDVALKLLRTTIEERRPANIILREARTLARLRHPNVVCVYGADVHDGRLGLWMEFVRGRTLAQLLAEYGTFSAREATVIGQEICRALVAVHGCDIVHSDLKAQNVMRESGGRLVLMDFGAGGTPVYMAPELLSGGNASVASDLYALGVLLFYLATGRYPVTGTSIDALRAAHVRGERRRLVDERADLPDDFMAVVHRALSVEPHDRYASAGEMLEALGGRPELSVHVPGTGSTGTKPRNRSIAVLPFVDLSPGRQLEYFCEGIAEEIISTLSAIPGLRVVARTSAFKFAGNSDDVRRVGSALNVGSVLEGSVRASGNRLRIVARLVDTADGGQLWSHKFDCVLNDLFAVQEDIAAATARALGAPPAPATPALSVPAGTIDFETYSLYLKGRHCWNQRTEATLQKSVAYFESALDRDPNYAEALAGLAEAYTTLGLYGVEPPLEIMPKALVAAERAIDRAPALAGPHAAAGCISSVFEWNWPAAERQFARAFELNDRDPVAHHWYAINHLVPLQRFDAARQHLAHAADADPLSMPIRLSLGMTSYFAHEFERAHREIEESLELDPGAITAHLFLGLTLAELGRHDEAVRAIETAHRLSPSPEMIAAIGYVQGRAGRVDAARESLRELQALSSGRYISRSLVAQVYAAIDETAAALDALSEAVAARAADLAWLGCRPVFDGLRREERFVTLLRSLSL